jgi:hypothetical protein
VTLAVIALALASCGGGSSSDQGSTATATAPTADTRAALDRRVADAEAAAKASPRSAQAFAALVVAHYRAASAGADPAGTGYSAAGRAHLEAAARAWESLLALDPKQPDTTAASIMAVVYGKSGLDEPRKAVAAQLVVAQRRNDAASYQQLAVMAYRSGDKRTGDLAAAEAVKLAPAADRKRIRDGLRQLRAGQFPGTG